MHVLVLIRRSNKATAGLGVVVERVLSTRGSGFKPWYLLLPPKKVRVYRRVSLGGHRCVVDVLEPFCISQP
jgi:hypothetical protein